MPSKIDILGQVMLSLKVDQNNVMNNINAMLNNADKETSLVPTIKSYIRELSGIHDAMRETEAFILQLTTESLKKDEKLNESGGTKKEKE